MLLQGKPLSNYRQIVNPQKLMQYNLQYTLPVDQAALTHNTDKHQSQHRDKDNLDGIRHYCIQKTFNK